MEVILSNIEAIKDLFFSIFVALTLIGTFLYCAIKLFDLIKITTTDQPTNPENVAKKYQDILAWEIEQVKQEIKRNASIALLIIVMGFTIVVGLMVYRVENKLQGDYFFNVPIVSVSLISFAAAYFFFNKSKYHLDSIKYYRNEITNIYFKTFFLNPQHLDLLGVSLTKLLPPNEVSDSGQGKEMDKKTQDDKGQVQTNEQSDSGKNKETNTKMQDDKEQVQNTYTSPHAEIVKMVIENFLKTERNFILEKDQKTAGLQGGLQQGEWPPFDKFLEMIKSVFSKEK
jgi:hypothetical protein